MEFMSVTTFKKERTDKRSYKLSFTNNDMVGVDTPHNDALILLVHIITFEVKRVLIDPGSLSEIMYHNLFRKLDMPPSQVKNTDMHVFSFNGEAVWPIAIAEVPIRVKEVKKLNSVDMDSPYNAILG